MTRIAWDAQGARNYERGLDRGVLYPSGGPGVPWNGLVSVAESVDGGELNSYYFDGIKYLDLIANEDFKATVEAMSHPPEFAPCEGRVALAVGLFATGQVRTTFGLSYRTLISSDTNPDLGYKLHIAYNCTAAPASRTRKTLSGDAGVDSKTWDVSTVPPPASTYKPTAHFIVDSTLTPIAKLTALENLLYGTASTSAALPTQAAVIAALA